jgi:glycosyltransferase involved in cell wall biosynthesis
VALAHDYLSQRGGAERVVLALARAFPEAPIYTSFYEPDGTFPEFARADIRTLPLDRIAPLRRRHRLALPLLAPAFSRLEIDARVAVCSSSGWAHGARVTGRKVVYCHAPARWLYQGGRYLSESGAVARGAVSALRLPLTQWDRRAAGTADRYLANSTFVADQVRRIYGLAAEVVHPPISIDVNGPRSPLPLIDSGYVLCVSRLLPYKNLEAVVRAFEHLPRERLVVVGDGPDEDRLRSLAGPNVSFVGVLPDPELRWLYAHAQALVTASYEDFGLTPLEAAAFGKPTAALRFGGFLDTILEDETGVFFDVPEPPAVAAALRRALDLDWDVDELTRHVDTFSESRFAARMHEVVAEELDAAGA